MDASRIAEYILFKAGEEEELISNMKLQKLLYYTQGFHIAFYDRKLFNEKIFHWAHGPVVPEIYFQYRECGNKAIDYPTNTDFSDVDQQSLELINDVLDIYGQFSASALRNMSHEEPPWKQTANNEEITPEILKEYFITRITDGSEEG